MAKTKVGFMVIGLLMWMAGAASAAGSCSQVAATMGSGELYKIVVSCTADASAGTVPNVTLSPPAGYAFWSGAYDAGSTGPTDAGDLALNDSLNENVLGGGGTDVIDNTTSTTFVAKTTAGDLYNPVCWGSWTQVISNISVNDATFTLAYTFIRVTR